MGDASTHARLDHCFCAHQDHIHSIHNVRHGTVEDDNAGDPRLGENVVCPHAAKSQSRAFKRSVRHTPSRSVVPLQSFQRFHAADWRRKRRTSNVDIETLALLMGFEQC